MFAKSKKIHGKHQHITMANESTKIGKKSKNHRFATPISPFFASTCREHLSLRASKAQRLGLGRALLFQFFDDLAILGVGMFQVTGIDLACAFLRGPGKVRSMWG